MIELKNLPSQLKLDAQQGLCQYRVPQILQSQREIMITILRTKSLIV